MDAAAAPAGRPPPPPPPTATMVLFGMGEFGDAWGLALQAQLGSSGPDAASPRPPASRREPIAWAEVRGRGKKAATTHLLCAVCDREDPEVAEAVAAAREEDREEECVVQWLEGLPLEADGEQWECWLEQPYDDARFAETKFGREKRWCTRTGIVRALTKTQKKVRSKLPACVEAKIQAVHGVSECWLRGGGS